MYIVETELQLTNLSEHIQSDTLIVDFLCMDPEKHPNNNKISLLFFYFLASKSTWCLPVEHNEALTVPNSLSTISAALRASIHKKMVFDKKIAIQVFKHDFDFIDLSLMKYLDDGYIDSREYITNSHLFVKYNFRNLANTNKCIPLYKHARSFHQKIENIGNINMKMVDDDGFKFVNTVVSNCFLELENMGICVNDNFTSKFGNEQTKHIKNNIVFSQYNLLTSTGRPSNRFGGVNYAALKKQNGSRKCFVSRHGSDGVLLLMDYNAFHPRLIAHLVNFKMDARENPYAYLAKYFFNKTDVTQEDIAESKSFTFTQLYGGIENKWLHIPYLSKIQEYTDHRWKFFTENGYVETPKYKRKIKNCHIESANPSKLFNYILQAFETETAVEVLQDLLTYLRNKNTKPVLYTYDSILFDVHKSDGMGIVNELKNIMERNKFPVKAYLGDNYDDMKQIL